MTFFLSGYFWLLEQLFINTEKTKLKQNVGHSYHNVLQTKQQFVIDVA
jgi:hypothetical protein